MFEHQAFLFETSFLSLVKGEDVGWMTSERRLTRISRLTKSCRPLQDSHSKACIRRLQGFGPNFDWMDVVTDNMSRKGIYVFTFPFLFLIIVYWCTLRQSLHCLALMKTNQVLKRSSSPSSLCTPVYFGPNRWRLFWYNMTSISL